MSQEKKGGGARMGKPQVRLSHVTFAMMLEEMLSGPCTAKHLSDHTGVGHRAMCMFVRTMKARKVIHIAGWERDSLGRFGIAVYGLGAGKDAPRVRKPREVVNREYRNRVANEPLKGTPFYGLGA